MPHCNRLLAATTTECRPTPRSRAPKPSPRGLQRRCRRRRSAAAAAAPPRPPTGRCGGPGATEPRLRAPSSAARPRPRNASWNAPCVQQAPGRRGRRGHRATRAAWEETVAAPAVTWDPTNMGDHPSVGQRGPPAPELAPWATAAPPARRANPKNPAPRRARLPPARPRRRTCSPKATDTPQQLLEAAARAKRLSACC